MRRRGARKSRRCRSGSTRRRCFGDGVRRARARDGRDRRSGTGLESGMAATIAMRLAKLGLFFLAGTGRGRVVPRAALLGSIAGISILLIAFLPMLKILRDPLIGLVALVSPAARARRSPCGCRSGSPGRSSRCSVGTLIFWGRASLGLGPSGAIGLSPLGHIAPMPRSTGSWRSRRRCPISRSRSRSRSSRSSAGSTHREVPRPRVTNTGPATFC